MVSTYVFLNDNASAWEVGKLNGFPAKASSIFPLAFLITGKFRHNSSRVSPALKAWRDSVLCVKNNF